MTGPLARLSNARAGRLARQFGAFGVVGVIGLAVDVAVLYAVLHGLALHAYGDAGFLAARVPSFFAAATATWALNRAFTFRTARRDPLHRQWAKFIAANSVGGVVNYAAYAGCIAYGALFTAHPALAVAVGSLAGMLFNFTASKLLVFREA
ncbi:GtrA family protein [Azospirillum halopraeferens]|uniref:GtrA family protein n=1 Tax=Azospirillum halopraeferens TaxID=34010 RepID=UPI00042A7A51|nr:GtrA family protein [Azospirillum halopraeferens]